MMGGIVRVRVGVDHRLEHHPRANVIIPPPNLIRREGKEVHEDALEVHLVPETAACRGLHQVGRTHPHRGICVGGIATMTTSQRGPENMDRSTRGKRNYRGSLTRQYAVVIEKKYPALTTTWTAIPVKASNGN